MAAVCEIGPLQEPSNLHTESPNHGGELVPIEQAPFPDTPTDQLPGVLLNGQNLTSTVVEPAVSCVLGDLPLNEAKGDLVSHSKVFRVFWDIMHDPGSEFTGQSAKPMDPVKALQTLHQKLPHREGSNLWKHLAERRAHFDEQVNRIEDPTARTEAMRQLPGFKEFQRLGVLFMDLQSLDRILGWAIRQNRGYTTEQCLQYFRYNRLQVQDNLPDYIKNTLASREKHQLKHKQRELTTTTDDAQPLNDGAANAVLALARTTYGLAGSAGNATDKFAESLRTNPSKRFRCLAAASLLMGGSTPVPAQEVAMYVVASQDARVDVFSDVVEAVAQQETASKQAEMPAPPAAEELAPPPMTVSPELIELIKESEGWKPHLYNDPSPARNATIGYGHLVHPGPIDGSEPEEFKQGLTEEQGEALLREDIARFEGAVRELVAVPLTQEQFDALVSFAFNIGVPRFTQSTLLERLNQGNYEAVPQQLKLWVKAKGKVLRGLIARREREIELWQRQSPTLEVAQVSLVAPQSTESPGRPTPEAAIPLDANISGLEIKDQLRQKYNQVSGHLEISELEPLGGIWEGHSLHPVAAHNFRELAAAFKAHFGQDLGLEASYRPYSRQVELKNSPRAAFAAKPGESDHGWGLSIDAASANNMNKFDSEEYKWMSENAHLYGWINPEKLRDGKGLDEAWHWLYVGAPDALRLRGGPPVSTNAGSSAVRVKVRSAPLNLPPIELRVAD